MGLRHLVPFHHLLSNICSNHSFLSTFILAPNEDEDDKEDEGEEEEEVEVKVMYLHVEINELIRKPHISFTYILFESPPALPLPPPRPLSSLQAKRPIKSQVEFYFQADTEHGWPVIKL